MISRWLAIGSVLLAGAIASFRVTAGADTMSTSGAVCQSFAAGGALELDHVTNGVRNIGTSPRSIICSVPRRAGTPGAAPSFYVDGQNRPGTCTTCTVVIYHYYGTVAAMQTLSSCPTSGTGIWEQYFSFAASAAAIGSDDYVSVVCSLPRSGDGVFYGVIAMQP